MSPKWQSRRPIRHQQALTHPGLEEKAPGPLLVSRWLLADAGARAAQKAAVLSSHLDSTEVHELAGLGVPAVMRMQPPRLLSSYFMAPEQLAALLRCDGEPPLESNSRMDVSFNSTFRGFPSSPPVDMIVGMFRLLAAIACAVFALPAQQTTRSNVAGLLGFERVQDRARVAWRLHRDY